jgi:hypothetical protein
MHSVFVSCNHPYKTKTRRDLYQCSSPPSSPNGFSLTEFPPPLPPPINRLVQTDYYYRIAFTYYFTLLYHLQNYLRCLPDCYSTTPLPSQVYLPKRTLRTFHFLPSPPRLLSSFLTMMRVPRQAFSTAARIHPNIVPHLRPQKRMSFGRL